jgi:hypothetical protein
MQDTTTGVAGAKLLPHSGLQMIQKTLWLQQSPSADIQADKEIQGADSQMSDMQLISYHPVRTTAYIAESPMISSPLGLNTAACIRITTIRQDT